GIGRPARLANWLYGVAYRVAHKARARAARRSLTPPVAEPVAPSTESQTERDELCRALDEELRRLPDRFRSPLVLCYLGGRSREEAAAQLGWSVGAVEGRLERGRELLRTRLTRRGVVPSAVLGAVLSESALSAAVPAALAASTNTAALAFAAGTSATGGEAVLLAEGVLQAMRATHMKLM